MNFLQETRLFSILSIILLSTILLGTFIFLNIIFTNFERYYTNLLFEKHKELLNLIKDENIEEIVLPKGEPFLLGIGIVSVDSEKFFPEYIRAYWKKSKKYLNDLNFSQVLKPIKTEDLYFQVALSPYKNKAFVSIYDSTTIGFIEEKIRILCLFVIGTALILPLFLYLFLKRAGKLYYALLKEARENPLVNILGEDPLILIDGLKKTNEELKILLGREKEKLSELKILSSTLSNNLPTGLLILDSEDNVLEANKYTLDLLKINKYNEGKTKLDEFFSSFPNLLKNIKDLIELKRPIEKRDIIEGEKNFVLTIAPLFKESHFLGTLILLEDVSEIKRLENILIEKENLASLGTFAAGIAHEVRNSLSTIIGYSKLLQKSKIRDEDQNYLNSLLDETNHLNNVITSFLEFTKIQKIERENIRLFELLKKVLEPLKMKYPEIKFTINSKDISLNIDSSLFGQALRAILENSCYEQKKGEIIINCEEKNNNLIMEIIDSGSGMDNETLKKAFIPFFSTKPDGTGLGLSLAHKIITLHKGSISIFSQKNKGTNVKIILSKEVLQNDTT